MDTSPGTWQLVRAIEHIAIAWLGSIVGYAVVFVVIAVAFTPLPGRGLTRSAQQSWSRHRHKRDDLRERASRTQSRAFVTANRLRPSWAAVSFRNGTAKTSFTATEKKIDMADATRAQATTPRSPERQASSNPKQAAPSPCCGGPARRAQMPAGPPMRK